MPPIFKKCRQWLTSISKRKKIVIAVAAIIVLLACTITGGYAVRHFYTKIFGIRITPAIDSPVAQTAYYLQNDPLWGSDTIGNSKSEMSNTGCLISCVASAMGELGVPVTPGELNEQLTEAGGFESDILLWYKINEIFPEVDYKYSRIFNSATIDEDLANGLFPIVNVKYLNSFATHWVMIVGAEDGEYMVYDPLNTEQKMIPLSIHGKVYAYRTLIHT